MQCDGSVCVCEVVWIYKSPTPYFSGTFSSAPVFSVALELGPDVTGNHASESKVYASGENLIDSCRSFVSFFFWSI